MDIRYGWNEEYGEATCTIDTKDQLFLGMASCHPEDEEFKSKLTGQNIAEQRAWMDYLRHIRDYELRPQLKILKQLYYSMSQSRKFNPKSYESIMLYRQIRLLENQLTTIKDELITIKSEVKAYIAQKDKEHQLIRELRKTKELVKND